MHSTHGSSDHEPQMLHLQPVREQPVLRFDHVAIAVSWEFCVEPIARLAGLAMADVVRQNKKVAPGIQRLARIEKLARELRPQEIAAIASGSMKDQHRIL